MLMCGSEEDSCVPGGTVEPLDLQLSESAVTLTRTVAMTPVTANPTGGSGNYAFSVSPSLPAGLSIDPTSGTISGTPTSITPMATYTVTVTDTGDANASFGFDGTRNGTSTATATLDLEVVEDTARVAQAFTDATNAFMVQLAERLLSSEPRSWRLDHRRRVSGPGNIAMRADDDGLALRFNTAVLGADGLWHFWAEGEYSRFTDRNGPLGAREGEFGLVSLGIDRLMNDRLALGLMVQLDRAGEESGTVSDISGTGWMVGPYVAAELRDGLFLAARLGWGRSTNDATINVYQDGSPWFAGSFDTWRSLARVTLYGQHALANGLAISPEVDLAWIRDRQSAYGVSDGLGTVVVPASAVERLRMTLGATLERDQPGQDGRVSWFVRPMVFTDRARAGGVTRNLTAGSLELGLLSGAEATWQGEASVRFDGLGQSGFEAWSLG